LRAHIETGDGSHITARIQGVSGWKQGAFALDVKPQERFLRAFVDTQVVFASLQGSGFLRDSVIEASLTASQVFAYGVMADSLDTRHRFEMGKRYVLLPSKLMKGEQSLNVSGEIGLSSPDLPMEWRVKGPTLGSVVYRQSRSKGMEVECESLNPLAFPYKLPDSLPPAHAVLDGNFHWNIDKRYGSIDLKANGAYQSAPFLLDIGGNWNPDSLHIEKLDIDQQGSRLLLQASVALPGEAFYDFKGFTPAHVASVTLESPQFDIAAVMGKFLPNPPLVSGVMKGKLSFSGNQGFQGSYRFLNLMPQADLGARLESLTLLGQASCQG
jgi:hypothetical protein